MCIESKQLNCIESGQTKVYTMHRGFIPIGVWVHYIFCLAKWICRTISAFVTFQSGDLVLQNVADSSRSFVIIMNLGDLIKVFKTDYLEYLISQTSGQHIKFIKLDVLTYRKITLLISMKFIYIEMLSLLTICKIKLEVNMSRRPCQTVCQPVVYTIFRCWHIYEPLIYIEQT